MGTFLQTLLNLVPFWLRRGTQNRRTRSIPIGLERCSIHVQDHVILPEIRYHDRSGSGERLHWIKWSRCVVTTTCAHYYQGRQAPGTYRLCVGRLCLCGASSRSSARFKRFATSSRRLCSGASLLRWIATLELLSVRQVAFSKPNAKTSHVDALRMWHQLALGMKRPRAKS